MKAQQGAGGRAETGTRAKTGAEGRGTQKQRPAQGPYLEERGIAYGGAFEKALERLEDHPDIECDPSDLDDQSVPDDDDPDGIDPISDYGSEALDDGEAWDDHAPDWQGSEASPASSGQPVCEVRVDLVAEGPPPVFNVEIPVARATASFRARGHQAELALRFAQQRQEMLCRLVDLLLIEATRSAGRGDWREALRNPHRLLAQADFASLLRIDPGPMSHLVRGKWMLVESVGPLEVARYFDTRYRRSIVVARKPRPVSHEAALRAAIAAEDKECPITDKDLAQRILRDESREKNINTWRRKLGIPNSRERMLVYQESGNQPSCWLQP